MLPCGYVAHDEAADPGSLLSVDVAVGSDSIVQGGITATWGTGASVWTYTVAYSSLGATPAPVAPAHARPLRERLRAGKERSSDDRDRHAPPSLE